MPQLSANLRYLFQELPLIDRFAAAARLGFKAVEYPFPYGEEPARLRRALDENQLQLVLINAPPGNWQAGDRGLAGVRGREQEFRKSIEEAIYYATCLNCRNVHIMAGLAVPGAAREGALSVLAENLKFAASACAEAGINALIEPLNEKDMPGYLLNHSLQARALLAVVNSQNLHLLLNLYHARMSGENLEDAIRANLEVIGHIQVAGVPGRAEPNTGDVDFGPIFELLDTLGYQGWIGCEYHPKVHTREGLNWASIYGIGSPFQIV
ncbi:MAG: TIM barrel protein [Rhodospirillales bacterium]|nr:TIM barrel protein [Rhodospirillales bacterium]